MQRVASDSSGWDDRITLNGIGPGDRQADRGVSGAVIIDHGSDTGRLA
jgi:hypothetical protein